MRFLRLARYYFGRITTLLILLSLWLGLGLLVAPEQPPLENERARLTALVGVRDFDFISWELSALWQKAESALAGNQHYLDESGREQVVLDFMALAGEVRNLNGQLNRLYAVEQDAAVLALESAELRQQIDSVRREMARIQPLAESIMQDQVATVLKQERFQILGSVFPPVQMHMTPLPSILIVSARDKIETIYSIPLQHGLTVPEQERLEQAVFDQLGLSALVVPIGGLAVYPSMVVETGNLNWTVATIAHEWVHHWLLGHPLGYQYNRDGVVRTINETVASVVGDEVGASVIEQFYPALVPPEAPPAGPAPVPDPDAFDFSAEMAETRIETDRLLGEGRIDEAEAYMQARQRFFVENGYLIRKINQAYFAFYGSYADQPGATGADPIGPAVVAARAASPSLHHFLNVMAPVTTLDQLERVLTELGREPVAVE